MIDFPPLFILMLVILLGLFAYYLRRPKDVIAGAAVSARKAVSVGKSVGWLMLALAACSVIFLIGANWVISIIFAAPVAVWLASVVIRD